MVCCRIWIFLNVPLKDKIIKETYIDLEGESGVWVSVRENNE